jgi:hypothetical protein
VLRRRTPGRRSTGPNALPIDSPPKRSLSGGYPAESSGVLSKVRPGPVGQARLKMLGTLPIMFDRLRRDVRNDRAGFAWFCAHGAALMILTVITWARGVWYWAIAPVLMVSYYTGQIVFSRRARRRGSSYTPNR